MRPILLVLVLAIAALSGKSATSQSFDISIRGLRAGALDLAGRVESDHYALSGRLESRGLLGLVRTFRYDATTRGRVVDDRFVPERYEELGRRGDRESRTVMSYRAGVPGTRVREPARKPDSDALDPATQAGTVDLLTGIWGLLRDVPREAACNYRAEMFDGEKRSRVVTGGPVVQGEAITCTGEYRRLGGFSAEEMAEKQRFPFRLTYRPGPAGIMQVERLEMETTFGAGVMTRR